MANRHLLSAKIPGIKENLLCTLGAVLLLSGLLGGCKQEMVPSDQDMIKMYLDNHDEIGRCAKQVSAEANQKFEVVRMKPTTYDGGSAQPPVSQATWSLCQQIMRRTFCLAVKREAKTVYFIFHEHDSSDYFRRKALVYDQGHFVDPIWATKSGPKSNLRYATVPSASGDSQVPNPDWKLEYIYEKH